MVGLEDYNLLKPWLLPAEHVLWAGRPPRGIRFGWFDLFLIPFSFAWGGFALYWNYLVWSFPAPWFFRLFGLPFAVIGLYIIAGRFLHDAWLRRRTLYAVTNRRILFVRTGRGGRAAAHDLAALPMCDLVERRDGSGTILFDVATLRSRLLGSDAARWTPPALEPRAFEGVDRARAVHDLINREAERARLQARS